MLHSHHPSIYICGLIVYTLPNLFISSLFSPSIERIIGLFAGLLIFTAQLILLKDVITKKISPSLLSWIGWALLMGTSLVAQIVNKGWQWSLTGLLLSTIGCVTIFTLALVLNNYLIKKADWYFLLLGLVCLAIYLSSKNPWLTTGFAILADAIVGIPTIYNGFKYPASQKTSAWLLALTSWTFASFICIGHSLLYALFPIYLFLFNGLMYVLTHRRATK